MATDKGGFPTLDIKAARALRPNVHQIRIDSILGGQSLMTHFSSPGQFRSAIAMDAKQPLSDNAQQNGAVFPSGLLRPVSTNKIPNGFDDYVTSTPVWIAKIAKSARSEVYVYDASGTVYGVAVNGQPGSISETWNIPASSGNGAAYYDNYMYFARDTSIARLGPLDNASSPSMTQDYWSTTLSMTNLTNPTYPRYVGSSQQVIMNVPNHYLHRHSDGALYIADTVNGQATIHRIRTTKSSVEGDTDNGSKYSVLQLGYGLRISCMESYGDYLAIAVFEFDGATPFTKVPSAKMYLWDTTSASPNSVVWDGIYDDIITSIKNVNGSLYLTTGYMNNSSGFRILQYVGGNSVREIFTIPDGNAPLPGAVDSTQKRLFLGSFTHNGTSAACVFALDDLNSGREKLSVPMRASNSTAIAITALCAGAIDDMGYELPVTGWTNGNTGSANNGLDLRSETYSSSVSSLFWSQIYRIGQPFKITKIRIPLAQALSTGMIVTPKIYIDSGTGSSNTTLTPITSANYGLNTQSVVIRPKNLTGDNDFFLELTWSGSALCTIALPITIEYELLDVDTAYP